MSFVKYDISLAVDRNFSIGVKGDMLFYISEDLKKFKERTTGNILVMGRKTLDSLPGGKPLPNRDNIVVSRSVKEIPGAYVVGSIEEIEPMVERIQSSSREEKKVYLVGGGNLVRQLMDQVEYWYITYVDKEYDNFDTQVPNLFEEDDLEIIEESEWRVQDDLRYRYITFRNKNFPEEG